MKYNIIALHAAIASIALWNEGRVSASFFGFLQRSENQNYDDRGSMEYRSNLRRIYKEEEEDRQMIEYQYSGNTVYKIYNDSYTETYSVYTNDDIDDFTFDYGDYEEYLEEYYNTTSSNEDGEGEDEDEDEDDFVDDGSIYSRIVVFQGSLDQLFSTSPLEWSQNQWGVFSGLVGIVAAFVTMSICCCMHLARDRGNSDDVKYDTDGDTFVDDDVSAMNQVSKNTAGHGIDYVQMSASGSPDKSALGSSVGSPFWSSVQSSVASPKGSSVASPTGTSVALPTQTSVVSPLAYKESEKDSLFPAEGTEVKAEKKEGKWTFGLLSKKSKE